MTGVYETQKKVSMFLAAAKKLYLRLLAAPAVSEADRRAQMEKNAQEMLQKYGNSILRLAYSYLHHSDDAEAVLQETLVHYIKTAPQFESDSQVEAWFMRVAINNSKKRISYDEPPKTDELSEDLEAAEEEDLVFVWKTVKELPEKYREILHLFYQEGYSAAQIAELLSKKETIVRSLLLRVRLNLKEELKEVYDFDA